MSLIKNPECEFGIFFERLNLNMIDVELMTLRQQAI